MSDELDTEPDTPRIIKTAEGLEVRINDDGSVTFVNLPEDMIEFALELDPDAVIACDAQGPESAADPRASD